MDDNCLVKTAKTQFDLSFAMLENMIEKCHDDIWNEKKDREVVEWVDYYGEWF